LVPVIFLTCALMYGVSGTAQSQASWEEDSTLSFIFRIVSLSNGLFAVLLGLELIEVFCTSRCESTRRLWWVTVIGHSGVSIAAAIQNFKLYEDNMDLSTLISECGLIFLSTVYIVLTVSAKGKNYYFLVEALSVLVFVIGLGYDKIYFGRCQSFQAYQFCYQECSIPTNVNENAYFNLATIVATIGWARPEHSWPSVVQRRNQFILLIYYDQSTSTGKQTGTTNKGRAQSKVGMYHTMDVTSPQKEPTTHSSSSKSTSLTELSPNQQCGCCLHLKNVL